MVRHYPRGYSPSGPLLVERVYRNVIIEGLFRAGGSFRIVAPLSINSLSFHEGAVMRELILERRGVTGRLFQPHDCLCRHPL